MQGNANSIYAMNDRFADGWLRERRGVTYAQSKVLNDQFKTIYYSY
jgi:hypothetical protein